MPLNISSNKIKPSANQYSYSWSSTAPAVLMTCPLLLPLVKSLGVDPIRFGVPLVVNLQISVLTPPVAASAFVAARIAGITPEQRITALLPFIGWGIEKSNRKVTKIGAKIVRHYV